MNAKRSLVKSLLCLLAFTLGFPLNLIAQEPEVHAVLDSLYKSPQRIFMIRVAKKDLAGSRLELAQHPTRLLPTSRFAVEHDALVAINGSFFDMENGGSVCYLERGDSVLHRSRPDSLKWAVPDSLANGAVVLSREHGLLLTRANQDEIYEKSMDESFVLVSGPLLIRGSAPCPLPDMGFSRKRHPRSCLGITEESLIFMTVDGRSGQAAGMSLYELQDFLLGLGCTDAINLDGGGSTTLWTRSRGVINTPSDALGERAVANAILLIQ